MDIAQATAKSGKKLKLKGEVFIIGDGITDYEMRSVGKASKFFAFTENVNRKQVVSKADQVIGTFDEFLYLNNYPRSQFYPKNRTDCRGGGGESRGGGPHAAAL